MFGVPIEFPMVPDPDGTLMHDGKEVDVPSGWSSGEPILVPDGMAGREANNHFAGRLRYIFPSPHVAPATQWGTQNGPGWPERHADLGGAMTLVAPKG